MAKLLSANEKRNLKGFSELEIEAAAWQLIQLRRGFDKIHLNTGVTTINKQRQDDQVNTDEEEKEEDDYYKPSDEVLSTGIDDDQEEEDGKLIKWRKRKFRAVDSIYCLTKPVMASNANKKRKKM